MTIEKKETSALEDMKRNIFKNEKTFKAILPKNFSTEKFMSTLFLECQKRPDLLKCSNLLEIAKDVATFGLVVGGAAGQADLIPYYCKNDSCHKASLIIGYKGYITKLEEQGFRVETEMVTHEEVRTGCFVEERGTNPSISHQPIRVGIRKRDDIALAYCILLKKGMYPAMSCLSKEECLEKAKKEIRKDGKKIATWGKVWKANVRETDFGQMCLKTTIRDCAKRVPCGVVNEMSAYEGKQADEYMKNVTPAPATVSDINDHFTSPKSDQVDPINAIDGKLADNYIDEIKQFTSKDDLDLFVKNITEDVKKMGEVERGRVSTQVRERIELLNHNTDK